MAHIMSVICLKVIGLDSLGFVKEMVKKTLVVDFGNPELP
jgi:hypothetical protein